MRDDANNANYGNTRSENGEKGDSNADVSNNSPLAPATNRIADQISGDSNTNINGADTRSEGDKHTSTDVAPKGVLIAPSSMGIYGGNASEAGPLVTPIDDDGFDNTHNQTNQ